MTKTSRFNLSRLDMNSFVLNTPTVTAGACTIDSFRINAGGSTGTLIPPVPGILCGVNTGQHSKKICRIQAVASGENGPARLLSTHILPFRNFDILFTGKMTNYYI